MADKKPETLKMPGLKEPTVIPESREPGKIHIDIYLQGQSVRLWERGGQRAFAIAKGKEFASEADFVTLFKSY